jgi:hypothetical protein
MFPLESETVCPKTPMLYGSIIFDAISGKSRHVRTVGIARETRAVASLPLMRESSSFYL